VLELLFNLLLKDLGSKSNPLIDGVEQSQERVIELEKHIHQIVVFLLVRPEETIINLLLRTHLLSLKLHLSLSFRFRRFITRSDEIKSIQALKSMIRPILKTHQGFREEWVFDN